MQPAILKMLEKYHCESVGEYERALREIVQEVALLGLWRSKFFEHAAFYGGTALRILYGLDRFSEDLDFSLLEPAEDFALGGYLEMLQREVRAFGFEADVIEKKKTAQSMVQSAFLKADAKTHLLSIGVVDELARQIPAGKVVKVKLEVDTSPSPGFDTEAKYLLAPIPFAVRTYTLPDLFAGKMHALLCRRWKNRVKGRDWYDLVWFLAHHPQLNLTHLGHRLRQSGHLDDGERFDQEAFAVQLEAAINRLDVAQARREVEPFARDPLALELWSKDFFRAIADRIELTE